jgi:chromosomal replication initiation ATPase DnaA
VELDGRYRFDNFVVGSANRLAAAAARAVAEAPGSTYNPLVIYGASGLGKSHLLGAIGCHAAALQPHLRVDALSLDEFVRQLHAAISVGQADAFRERYGHTEVLLLDDIQFLTGRRETQAEVLRLCQTLHESGRQIVLTSDRPPQDIPDVDERLVARLVGGLVVDIGAPDYETRAAMLTTWCRERGVQYVPGVIEQLARLDLHNIRELQGALTRVVAFQGLAAHGRRIELEDVRKLFAKEARPDAAAGVGTRADRAGRAANVEYLDFLSEVAHAVAQHVEPWRSQLAEAAAYWSGEGYRVALLERVLHGTADPGTAGIIRAFVAAVERLRALEHAMGIVDPTLAGTEVFRDPERVSEAEALVARAQAGATPPPGPSQSFTRAGFEVGNSNLLAVRAGDAVVSEPGSRFNPLFIHGSSGVGKTHLLHAIGNGLLRLRRGAVAACIGAQELTDELIAALRDGQVDRWRSRYRLADALLIDDVHFLAGKERTQEELFHVFNDLHRAGKQIILSSDRPPRELAELEERLRSRFAGGLVAEIECPDHDLRVKLFQRYLHEAAPGTDAALAQYLGERPAASVREILGTVNRLVAAAELTGGPLTLDLARDELEGPGVTAQGVPANLVAVAADVTFLDAERVVWDWPEAAGRVIEEWR